jgi:hypothetical protein
MKCTFHKEQAYSNQLCSEGIKTWGQDLQDEDNSMPASWCTGYTGYQSETWLCDILIQS